MKEFKNHFNSNSSFNVLICSDLQCRTSLPSPYLLDDGFSQEERSLQYISNFDENFFNKIGKIIPKDQWNLVISEEGFLNKIEKVPCFSPFRKQFLLEKLGKFIQEKSKQFPKSFFIFNFIYVQKKKMTASKKEQITKKILNYDDGNMMPELIETWEKNDDYSEKMKKSMEFNYLLIPSKRIKVGDFYEGLSNKTLVWLNGDWIAGFRKRVLGFLDFDRAFITTLI